MRSKSAPSKSGKRREYDVTPEEFIAAWQESATAEEAAERLKMPKPIVCARATNYRRVGVRLKMMPRIPKNRRRIDVNGLNALIAKLETQQGGPPTPEGSSRVQKLGRNRVAEVMRDVVGSVHGPSGN